MNVFLFLLVTSMCFAATEEESEIRAMVEYISNPKTLDPKAGTQMCSKEEATILLNSEACKPKFQCGFYTECMNKLLGCNTAKVDYVNNYGDKYCQIFEKKLYPNMGAAGQIWTRCTMVCLQQSLLDEYKKTNYSDKFSGNEKHEEMCQRYHTAAFDSHPNCYTSNGLCYLLPPSEQFKILKAVDSQDLWTEESGRQVLAAIENCGMDFLDQSYGTQTGKTDVQAAVVDVMNKSLLLAYCDKVESEFGRRLSLSSTISECQKIRNKLEDGIKKYDSLCK